MVLILEAIVRTKLDMYIFISLNGDTV